VTPEIVAFLAKHAILAAASAIGLYQAISVHERMLTMLGGPGWLRRDSSCADRNETCLSAGKRRTPNLARAAAYVKHRSAGARYADAFPMLSVSHFRLKFCLF
jgi:hypothetical protein